MQKSNIQKKIFKRLGIEELRKYKGFENFSDKETEETIISLEKLSILMYELFRKSKLTLKKIQKTT